MNSLKQLFFPEKCILCGEVMGQQKPFCGTCYSYWTAMPNDNCIVCGCDAHECNCSDIRYTDRVVFAFWYGEEPLKSLIYRLKYHPSGKTAAFIAEIMATEVRRRLTGKRGKLPFEVVTFVPRSKKSLLRYGHDQAAMLAEQVAKLLGLPCVPLLCRTSSGKQQKSLGLTIRLENIRGAFIPKRDCANYKRVLLVDDIITTGATMSAAAHALKDSGIKFVFCAAAAKTNKNFINSSIHNKTKLKY